MPSYAAIAPIAQHRGREPQLACDLDQRPTAARQQGDRLHLELIRKMTPFLAHSTPSRSRRSLAKVSTNAGEAQRSPPLARGRAWPSARQRCTHRLALLMLTSNRSAAARALPPSAMKPITRSLRSCEYGAGISPPLASSNPSLANPSQGPKNPFFICLPDRKPL